MLRLEAAELRNVINERAVRSESHRRYSRSGSRQNKNKHIGRKLPSKQNSRAVNPDLIWRVKQTQNEQYGSLQWTRK